MSQPNNKLKIGILSINSHTMDLNFACPLHSLVFSNALTSLGYDNVIINYYPVYSSKEKNAKKEAVLAANLPGRKERFEKFEAFVEQHYNYTENEYSAAVLDAMPNAEGINCYIAATDTIWRYYAKGFDKGFLLNCRAMQSAYKIAYSASRGPCTYGPVEEKIFFNYINNINDISVREESFADYITENSDINAQVVLDPVFLAPKGYYDSLAIAPEQKGYVLIYLMQEKNAEEFLDIAAKFAKDRGLDLIELSKFFHHTEQTGYDRHRVIYDIGIEEWLGYIKHADYVFTNSFHGSCFSIMFEKQFFFNGKRGGDKVKLLFKRFGLEWRSEELAFDENANLTAGDIDYAPVNEIRERLLAKSLDFLKTSLKKAEQFVETTADLPDDYFKAGDKYLCTGCTTCAKRCPTNAITKEQDNEGFWFPAIDEASCVKCGLCSKVCPHNGKQQLYAEPQNVYLAFNKDENVRANSSSGGIVGAMTDYILKQGGAVVGVRFNEHYEALYDIAETAEDCLAFRFSKYVEAADNDIYPKTKAALETGRKVLFSGTPCKVAGLLNFLGKDYDNLYCIDTLCHGTNSPLMLKKYLEEKQEEQGSRLSHFQFRSPKAPQGPVTIEFQYENGQSEIANKHTDLYMGGFLKNVMLKRSCYACEYCGNNGISDITFGDFWGGKQFYTKDDANKGLSCLKVNTPKGKALFQQLNIYAQEQTVEEMYAKNHKRPSKFPPQRDKIFEWINYEGLSATQALVRATAEDAAKPSAKDAADITALKRENAYLKSELRAAKKDTQQLQDKIQKLYKSTSWRLTKPIRSLGRIVRKILR